ncbi:MAG: class II fumarate hydratase [Phycisphaerae bacterium]
MSKMRKERDSMGEMDVPVEALYGAQTARAVSNFPVSGWTMPREFIAALGTVKLAAATAHKQAGRIEADKADAIIAAAREVIDGRWDEHFPVDVFQTGSGTSSNMNANEVVANRAIQILGGRPGDRSVHPNDDVNRGQSSNDVIPTALHVSAAVAIDRELLPALNKLRDALQTKADEFDRVVKIGRTHGMDAVPVRLGQEFGGYAAQVAEVIRRLGDALESLRQLPLGGTAVGTGLNAPEGFAPAAIEIISRETDLEFREAGNHFAAQAAKDDVVFASGVVRMAAVAMGKIAGDIRLLSTGPRCGIGELHLPATQPGSSIMPGKVNPVMCESVIQAACQVVGCDAAITAGATGGVGSILELNVAMPMMAWNILTAIRVLSNVADVFVDKCIDGLQADEEHCHQLTEQSLAMCTALAPEIGYDQAAAIAHEAYETGKTIRRVCQEKQILPKDKLDDLLDAKRQTGK